MTAPERIWATEDGFGDNWWSMQEYDGATEYVRAAQADFDARTMSAIAIQPDPRDEVIARLVEAVEHLLLNYLQDEFDEPDLCVDEGHWLAISDLRAILAAIPQKDAPND